MKNSWEQGKYYAAYTRFDKPNFVQVYIGNLLAVVHSFFLGLVQKFMPTG